MSPMRLRKVLSEVGRFASEHTSVGADDKNDRAHNALIDGEQVRDFVSGHRGRSTPDQPGLGYGGP